MTSPGTPASPHPASAASPDHVRLSAEGLTLRYDQRIISESLGFDVPPGSFTVIIGPNASGKSTLLRALSGLLKPTAGSVVLDGADIAKLSPKRIAARIGLLPQSSSAPDGITVAELVSRGRFAHQRMLRQWSPADEAAVAEALNETATRELSARRVDELSGGQRQRVWIAMVLAQQTPMILLDEPTTFLDVAHQIDVLNLLHRLNSSGRTVVAVLHDLNQAARYASHIVAMADGRIVAQGSPGETITSQLVHDVFSLPNLVIPDPATGTPLVIPRDTR
ncbi:ABC transporter ATP-binding protein [Microbacterium halotolerans]|uniref:ABC transporter ATP-binding protein n=1 Tax=Microbacterium halotolerans TaxID=246613 RepID=UPI000E6AA25C|nr:ABC transporter ATP-binding protein [Microbacterium halotolerans]